MNIKIGVVSLGCSKNLVDTEVTMGYLEKNGCEIVSDPTDAEAIIINTCGFIESAKQESINTILEMSEYKNTGNCKALIIMGCLAQRYKEEIIKEIPEVDAVISLSEYPNIPQIINDALKISSYNINELNPDDYINRLRSTQKFISYVKISDGCDNNCTYCVIPSIRGPYKSRTIESITEEAKFLAKEGVKELIIIAQDTTKYGIDIYGEVKLVELLKELCKIDGIQWIRLLYAYPDSIDERLIDLMGSEKKICKYIDIPIQHINNRILRAMGRRTSTERIKEVISKLRTKMPEIAIRTSLIVGFPGETEEEFSELLSFVEETKFDKLGVFTYSKEEGTPAARMSNHVLSKEKKKRHSKIMKIQKSISKEINKNMIGKRLVVLIEQEIEDGVYVGRTYRDAPEIDGIVYVSSKTKLIQGDLVNTTIIKSNQYDLIGEVTDEFSE